MRADFEQRFVALERALATRSDNSDNLAAAFTK